MKRLLVAMLLSLSLGLAAHQNAYAGHLTFPDSSQAQLQIYSGGRLAFLFFDWAGDWDVFTTHFYGDTSPAFINLGAGSVLGYWCDYQYSTPGRMYVNVYGNTGGSWFFIGLYYI
jgi:hypothetical protein